MNKIFGLIIGVLSGVIAASVWVYIDSITNKDCYSLYQCQSSWIYNFGMLKLVLLLGIVGGVTGLLVSWVVEIRKK